MKPSDFRTWLRQRLRAMPAALPDSGWAARARQRYEESTMDNVTAAYVNAPGEPPNTMSRMQATIDATCAEIGAIASERLRAAWAEVVQLHEDTKAIKATYASSSVIWNARADALADYLDDIDTASDRAKGDDTAYRALVQQKIDQSHTIVRVDGGARLWDDPVQAKG